MIALGKEMVNGVPTRYVDLHSDIPTCKLLPKCPSSFMADPVTILKTSLLHQCGRDPFSIMISVDAGNSISTNVGGRLRFLLLVSPLISLKGIVRITLVSANSLVLRSKPPIEIGSGCFGHVNVTKCQR